MWMTGRELAREGAEEWKANVGLVVKGIYIY